MLQMRVFSVNILLLKSKQYYWTQTKLREGNVFTRVCLFTGEGVSVTETPGNRDPPHIHIHTQSTAAGGTHPTGMNSC